MWLGEGCDHCVHCVTCSGVVVIRRSRTGRAGHLLVETGSETAHSAVEWSAWSA